jgi:hypothetical protein
MKELRVLLDDEEHKVMMLLLALREQEQADEEDTISPALIELGDRDPFLIKTLEAVSALLDYVKEKIHADTTDG